MTCPHCESTATTERSERTALGYRRFRCRACRRGFNERTGTLFNYLEYPTDVVCLVVFWRFRYKLILRDLAEMFLQRGIQFTHEAVRNWETKLAPLLSDTLRKRRRGAVGNSWGLNSATAPCMDSNKVRAPLALVASLMKSVPFSVPNRAAIKRCHSSNDETSTKIGLPS